MPNGDTHAENRPALFSLPEAAPAMVLRAGALLKASGHPAAAIEIYENFIAGLRNHAMNPIEFSPIENGTNDGERAEAEFLSSLPVRAHPERYSHA
jgi:hypothetical protein